MFRNLKSVKIKILFNPIIQFVLLTNKLGLMHFVVIDFILKYIIASQYRNGLMIISFIMT